MKYPDRIIALTADICVIGGGMAGICAAVSAARHGAKVVLMQDRPVLYDIKVLPGSMTPGYESWWRVASEEDLRELSDITDEEILSQPYMAALVGTATEG